MATPNFLQHPAVKALVRYFVRGLLFMIPIAITAGALVWLYNLVEQKGPFDNFFYNLGLILVIVLGSGFIASWVIARPMIDFIEDVLERAPLVKFIYSSIKDLTEAFFGEKKSFTHPVLVRMTELPEVWRMGFITRDNLREITGDDRLVAVYVPMSYSLSGNMILVPVANVRLLDINPTQAMKFIVSGGVTGFTASEEEKAKAQP